jgi:hypothetical protein
MNRLTRLPLLLASCALLTLPASAAEVIGAGSGSTGGMVNGTTNENTQTQKTGAANGDETVQSQGHKAGVGTGDNAVLNAPREAVPGTQPKSQPSNLNGQDAQP